MRIAFFEVENWTKEYFKRHLKRHKVSFSLRPLSAKNVSKYKDIDCFVTSVHSECTPEVLSKLPKLKYIATRSTGYDHIDTAYCKKNKIAVMNVPAYGENTVAEFTFTLLLALTRKLYGALYQVREENVFSCKPFKGLDLCGKTIGIVGAGKIGRHVIRIAHGFDMNILVCSHHPDKKLAKKYGVKFVSFKTLLKKSDIVSLHVPYTPKNHHMLNKKTIALMKKGALVVNTARGGLIDTDALYKALKRKHLAGAALDVIEEECIIAEEKQLLSLPKTCDLQTVLENHKLMKMDNVLITPHIAWHSKEAMERIMKTTVDNLNSIKSRIKNKVKL